MSDPTPERSGPPVPPAGAPVPRLRRDPSPSQVSGRRVLIGAFVFFLLLLTFVIVLVVTIGLHNHGVKIPPGPKPHATQPS
ncbi:MAG TPA: hypothetical protein VME70_16245 [Mycobacteriales bacterium]|nr:hypothetical protein [Mycobacteriales bacterium]